jgi:hypothetical protein
VGHHPHVNKPAPWLALALLGISCVGCSKDSPATGTVVVSLRTPSGPASGVLEYTNQPDQIVPVSIPDSGSLRLDLEPGVYNTSAFRYTDSATTPTDANCAGPPEITVVSGDEVALSYVCRHE